MESKSDQPEYEDVLCQTLITRVFFPIHSAIGSARSAH